jgi:HlyD family secretion protein
MRGLPETGQGRAHETCLDHRCSPAIAAGSAFIYLRLQPQPAPLQLVFGSGRIEADEVRVAPEIPGRLVANTPREGETVRGGEIVARLDPVDYELQASQAEAQRSASRYAAAQIDAQINLAGHHAMTARSDLARYESLLSKGWVTVPQVDARRNTYQTAVDQLSAFRQQRAQADAQTAVAGRTLDLARQRLGRAWLTAPISGAVLERLVEPGEVVSAGQPILILADLRTVRLKVFVAESDLGKIRLGASARIRVDAFPNRDFPARVARIDPQAQFTPRDVHVRDERVRTVYGVMLEAPNPQGVLKPGMPADGWILWDVPRGWPARLVVPE